MTRILFRSAFWVTVLAISLHAETRWVGSWASSQQLPEPRNSLAPEDLQDATVRQMVHLSAGGSELRVHLSNRFGTAPLRFAAVHIAYALIPSSPRIVAASDKALLFGSKPDVTIPAGADYVSDPVSFSAPPLSDIAITFYMEQAPASQTGHPGSRTTTYLVHGNRVSAADLANPKTVEHWYFLAGLDVASPPDGQAIVTLGDSITDGHGATTNGNDRWPDLLARRLQAAAGMQSTAVLNHGIGGNRLLLDGLGPNALARFDHDVLAQPGVRYLMILEGVNDLGMLTHDKEAPQADHDALVAGIIGAYEQMIARAHTHDIRVIGCTILPYVGSAFYHPGPVNEADRQAINTWIRAPGHFDAVVDFDQVTRDPAHPDSLLPSLDSGDHLHPSPAGYAAMADAVPLTLFGWTAPSRGGAPKVAFTFDDLPAHGPLPPNTTRIEIANKLNAALHDAGVPPTYGFVNGKLLEQQPADVNVLQAWRAAGNLLGNHAWSHMNLNQNTMEAFSEDVLRNEPVISDLMKGQDWHWFRFPFLAEGDTPEKHAAVRAFLAKHKYKVASVTMSFNDWMWTDPYARCKQKGDAESIEALKNSYFAAVDASIGYHRGLSQKLYGHDIPYVLLMHISPLDAEVMPKLLQLYHSRGFQFVSITEAERDEFYRKDVDTSLPPGPPNLEAATGVRGLPLPARVVPSALLDGLCR